MWCIFVLAPEADISTNRILGPYRSYDKVERALARIDRLFPDASAEAFPLVPDHKLAVAISSFAKAQSYEVGDCGREVDDRSWK